MRDWGFGSGAPAPLPAACRPAFMWFFVLRYCNRLPFACRSLQPPFQYRSHLLLLSLSLPFPIPNPESPIPRSEEHTSELQSLMRISSAVFCLKQKKRNTHNNQESEYTELS